MHYQITNYGCGGEAGEGEDVGDVVDVFSGECREAGGDVLAESLGYQARFGRRWC